MAHETLTDFFREKKAKTSEGIDWKAEKDAWVKAVNDLYDKIEREYLAGPVAEGLVRVSKRQRTLVEDFINEPYQVNELVLQVNDEDVYFRPKGRIIVGASGRVDIAGEMGTRTMVLRPGQGWGIVVERTPTLKIVPLDEGSLLAALKDVMRG